MSTAIFFGVISRNLFLLQLHLCPLWALLQPPGLWQGSEEVGLWQREQGFSPSVCLNKPSPVGLSRACLKGQLCLCIWFCYPLQMSAWMLPSVPWQFSSPHCMIAPPKCVLSWFGILCVYLPLCTLSFYSKCYLLFFLPKGGGFFHHSSEILCVFLIFKNVKCVNILHAHACGDQKRACNPLVLE